MPAACLALMLTGCQQNPAPAPATPPAGTSSGAHKEHGHEHPSEGPHHGHLVELGNEEFHAEVVHEKDTVTVYILDGTAKSAVPIEATELTINLSHDGKPEQFKLDASRDSADPEGKSSRFVSKDEHLGEALDAKGSSGKLVVTIQGKQYTGKVSHDHDHDHAGHKH